MRKAGLSFLLCTPEAGRHVGIRDKVTPGFFLTENQTCKAPRPGQVFAAFFIFSHAIFVRQREELHGARS